MNYKEGQTAILTIKLGFIIWLWLLLSLFFTKTKSFSRSRYWIITACFVLSDGYFVLCGPFHGASWCLWPYLQIKYSWNSVTISKYLMQQGTITFATSFFIVHSNYFLLPIKLNELFTSMPAGIFCHLLGFLIYSFSEILSEVSKMYPLKACCWI